MAYKYRYFFINSSCTVLSAMDDTDPTTSSFKTSYPSVMGGIGLAWKATEYGDRVVFTPRIYRYYRYATYDSASLSYTLSYDGVTKKSGSWSFNFTSGNNDEEHYDIGTVTVYKGTSSKTVTMKCTTSSGFGFYYSGFKTVGSRTFTFTYTVPSLASYTITYNGNGVSDGVPASGTKVYGKNYTIASMTSSKEGYTFSKWNTEANGSGSSYNAGDTYTANANLALYAIWTQSSNMVSYVDFEGKSLGYDTKIEGQTLNIRTALISSSYNFDHWNTQADNEGVDYTAGAEYSEDVSMTLYAIGEATNLTYKRYTVTKTQTGDDTYTYSISDTESDNGNCIAVYSNDTQQTVLNGTGYSIITVSSNTYALLKDIYADTTITLSSSSITIPSIGSSSGNTFYSTNAILNVGKNNSVAIGTKKARIDSLRLDIDIPMYANEGIGKWERVDFYNLNNNELYVLYNKSLRIGVIIIKDLTMSKKYYTYGRKNSYNGQTNSGATLHKEDGTSVSSTTNKGWESDDLYSPLDKEIYENVTDIRFVISTNYNESGLAWLTSNGLIRVNALATPVSGSNSKWSGTGFFYW